MDDNTTLAAALSLAARGFQVFRVHGIVNGRCTCETNCNIRDAGKHPWTPKGFEDATTDPHTIQRWFARHPDANIGIRTGAGSGVVGVDVDDRDDGSLALSGLEEQYGLLPETLTAKTGNGRHLYFKHPGGHLPCAKLAPGIDFKADGGYLVAPPSMHRTGVRYEFIDPRSPVADMPAWVLQLAQKPDSTPPSGAIPDPLDVLRKYEDELPDSFEDRLAEIPDGDWSKPLFGIELRCFEAGMSREEVFAVAWSAGCNKYLREKRPESDLWKEVLKAEAQVRGGVEDEPQQDSPKSDAQPFQVYGIDDLGSMPTVEWVVDGVTQDCENNMLYGPGGSFKSLVALDKGLHVVAGLPWRGRAVKQGYVLFVYLENHYAVPGRVKAWMHQHPDADLSRFKFITSRVLAKSEKDIQRLYDTIDTLPEPPVLVVIDTQQRFAHGLKGNDNDDMDKLVAVLDNLRAKTGRAVEVVHHSGKDKDMGPRGGSVLVDSFISVHLVERGENGPIVTDWKVNNSADDLKLKWNVEAMDITIQGKAASYPYLVPSEADALTERDQLAHIHMIVAAEPGISRRGLTGQLTGQDATRRATVDRALGLGVIVNRGTAKHHKYYVGDRDPSKVISVDLT